MGQLRQKLEHRTYVVIVCCVPNDFCVYYLGTNRYSFITAHWLAFNWTSISSGLNGNISNGSAAYIIFWSFDFCLKLYKKESLISKFGVTFGPSFEGGRRNAKKHFKFGQQKNSNTRKGVTNDPRGQLNTNTNSKHYLQFCFPTFWKVWTDGHVWK